MSDVITFYDIPSTIPGIAWSPNTFKTRYSLNLKRIPYKTEWVEYPDIEAVCKKNGIPASYKKADGSPLFTLPAIYDPSTKTALSDSIRIAEYLDATYPDTPKLFPPGSRALQRGTLYAFYQAIDPLWDFALPATNAILNPRSEEYFRRTRELENGKTLEELMPKGKPGEEQWAKVRDGFGAVDAWLQKGKDDGPYFLGNYVCFTDLAVASFTIWLEKIFGEESREWADIKTWHDGRLVKFLRSLDKYAEVD